MSTMTDDAPLELPTPEELNILANVLCEVAGEVERIKIVLEQLRGRDVLDLEEYRDHVWASKRGIDLSLPGESFELGADQAWRLHRFADDVQVTVRDFADYAETIDRLTLELFDVTSGENEVKSPAEHAAFRDRMARWYARRGRKHSDGGADDGEGQAA